MIPETALSEDVIARIDKLAGSKVSRSSYIDQILRDFVDGLVQARKDAREIAAINRHAAKLNAEMSDATQRQDLPTQVAVSTAEGLKHESAIQSDGLMSLENSRLTDFVGKLAPNKMRELDNALIVALGIPAGTRPPA